MYQKTEEKKLPRSKQRYQARNNIKVDRLPTVVIIITFQGNSAPRPFAAFVCNPGFPVAVVVELTPAVPLGVGFPVAVPSPPPPPTTVMAVTVLWSPFAKVDVLKSVWVEPDPPASAEDVTITGTVEDATSVVSLGRVDVWNVPDGDVDPVDDGVSVELDVSDGDDDEMMEELVLAKADEVGTDCDDVEVLTAPLVVV